MKFLRSSQAFSLVEVALALGVIAFAVVGIMGLLATAINSGKASTDDTLVADMATQIVNDMRHQYFVDGNQGRLKTNSGVLVATDDVDAGGVPQKVETSVFFDVSGARLQSGNPPTDMNQSDALSAGAIYRCKITTLADATTLSATGTGSKLSPPSLPDPNHQATNLLYVTLAFSWPASASSPNNAKTINATIARY